MRGFTFIEMLIVVSISAIVLTLATPSFGTMIRNNRLTSQVKSYTDTLNLARSEAVKRRISVTVCKSSDGATCVTSGDFSQGWIVFTDDKTTIGTVDAEESILQVYEVMDSTLDFTGIGTGGSNIANFVTYSLNGTTQDRGDITLCDVSLHARLIHLE
jgi:type IV fimbrial biogenesis protein FimT